MDKKGRQADNNRRAKLARKEVILPVERIDVKLLAPLFDAVIEAAERDGEESPQRWIALQLAKLLDVPEDQGVPARKKMGRPRLPRQQPIPS